MVDHEFKNEVGSGRFYYFTIANPYQSSRAISVWHAIQPFDPPFPSFVSRFARNLDIHQCSTVKLISVGITSGTEEWAAREGGCVHCPRRGQARQRSRCRELVSP